MNEPSPDDIKWMSEALKLAEEAAAKEEVPVGAIVVQGDRIVGRGFNLRETDQDPLAHAEVLAIRDAAKALGSWRLIGCKLYVTLEPCPMCLAACQLARVDEAIYGAKDLKGGALSLGYHLNENPKTNHRFPVRFSEMARCGEILSRFFAGRRKPKSG